MPKTTATKTRKVLVEFPEDLLRQTEQLAAALSTSRANLIRNAVRAYLQRKKRAELERALAEGYQAHAEFDRRVTEEFTHADRETF